MKIVIQIAKRAPSALLVLLVLLFVVFCLQRLTPVNPARALAGDRASESALQSAYEQLGLDEPLYVQFVRSVTETLHGNLGISGVTQRPVLDDLSVYLPASLELLFAALLVAIPIGLILGVSSAQRSRGSGFLRFSLVLGSSVPIFLTALLLIIMMSQQLRVLPAAGQSSFTDGPIGPTGVLLLDALLAGRFDVFADGFSHLVLPALCLAIAPAVAIGRVLRSSLSHTMRADYIRTARMKGLSEFTVLRSHGLRNSINAPLSMAGIQIAAIIGSLVVVEDVFAWPGIGLYAVQALDRGDFTTISGVTLALGLIFVLANAVVDGLQMMADPRIAS